jgi:hypothetical protein
MHSCRGLKVPWQLLALPAAHAQQILWISRSASGRFGHDLRVVLVEIQYRVKLRLLRQQILEPGFMLEWAAQLRPVIRQRLLLPLDFLAFFLGLTVKPAKHALDALDGALRVLQIQIGLVRLLAPDKQIGFPVFEWTSRGSGFRSP